MAKVTHSTLLIHVESGQYPVSLSQVRRAHPQVSIATEPTEESILALGYAVVKTVPRPVGDVVTEGRPEKTEEGYVQTWDVREFNEAEKFQRLQQRKSELANELRSLQERALEKGFPYLFPNGSVEHIQLRDGDRANITGLRVKADAYVRNEQTDAVMYFRTFENNMQVLNPEQMSTMADAAFDGYNQILMVLWNLKDDIELAETMEELPVIPAEVELQYPQPEPEQPETPEVPEEEPPVDEGSGEPTPELPEETDPPVEGEGADPEPTPEEPEDEPVEP